MEGDDDGDGDDGEVDAQAEPGEESCLGQWVMGWGGAGRGGAGVARV